MLLSPQNERFIVNEGSTVALGLGGRGWALRSQAKPLMLWWLGDGLHAQKLSLREKYREELYDAERKPRLNYARSYFRDFSIDQDFYFTELQEFFQEWRDFDEYLVLQRQTDNLRIKGEVDKETIAVKCAKRGNDVYWWRVSKRLRSLHKLENHTFFDIRSNAKFSNVLFATLTYDITRSSIKEAWETVGAEYNKWIRNLRK